MITDICMYLLYCTSVCRELMPPVTTIEELQQIQANYFSFLTVRHPFERILSAYRDRFFNLSETKMEKNKAAAMYELYGRSIISQFRPDNSTALDAKYLIPSMSSVITLYCVGTERSRHSLSLLTTCWRLRWRTTMSTGSPSTSSAPPATSTTQSLPRRRTFRRTAGQF